MSDPTTTSATTLKTIVDVGLYHSAFDELDIGTMLAGTEYDTGTITGTTSITLPYEAAAVQSCRVVSGVATVGVYQVSDSNATLSAALGANTSPGVCKIATDRKTLTFYANVTRVVVRYLPMCTSGKVTGLGSLYSPATKG